MTLTNQIEQILNNHGMCSHQDCDDSCHDKFLERKALDQISALFATHDKELVDWAKDEMAEIIVHKNPDISDLARMVGKKEALDSLIEHLEGRDK